MPHGVPRRQLHPSTLRHRPPPRQSARSLCLSAGSGSGVRACAEEPARGAQGLVPKWRSAVTASLSPPSGAGAGTARGQRRAGCRASGRTAHSLSRAACRRRRDRIEGALCRVIGPASAGGQRGLHLDGSARRGESGGVRRPRGTRSCPECSSRAAGRVLVSVVGLGPRCGRRLCLLVAVRQSCCRTTLRSVWTLAVPYSKCSA